MLTSCVRFTFLVMDVLHHSARWTALRNTWCTSVYYLLVLLCGFVCKLVDGCGQLLWTSMDVWLYDFCYGPPIMGSGLC